MVEGRRWEQLSYKQFDSLDNMIPSLSTRRDTDTRILVRVSDHTDQHMMMMIEMRREEETMTSRQPKMIQTPGKKKINSACDCKCFYLCRHMLVLPYSCHMSCSVSQSCCSPPGTVSVWSWCTGHTCSTVTSCSSGDSSAQQCHVSETPGQHCL